MAQACLKYDSGMDRLHGSQKNRGMETSLAIMEVIAGFNGRKKMIDRDRVKEIFRRLDEAGIRYALIGGLAYSEYAPPRATQDVDILALPEDAARIRGLFPGCYKRGTPIAGVYEIEGTRFDVQPARLQGQIASVKNAVEMSFYGQPVRVAALRDLLFLKLWASSEGPELGKKTQDQADLIQLIEHNREKVLPEDTAYMARTLLALVSDPETQRSYREAVLWLNETLDKLGMADRKHLEPL
jgi:hypothetical protein